MDDSLNTPILGSDYIHNAVLLKNMINDEEIIKYAKSKILIIITNLIYLYHNFITP